MTSTINFPDDVRYAVVGAGKDEPLVQSFASKRETETFLNSLTFDKSVSKENIEAVIASTASEME